MPIRKGVSETPFLGDKERHRAKKIPRGNDPGAFDGALDDMAARLISRRKLGYLVELLASKPPFHKGDRVHLSPAEFTIHHDHPRDPAT